MKKKNPKTTLTSNLFVLRKHLIKSLLAIGIAFIPAYIFKEDLLKILTRPLKQINNIETNLIYLNVPDAFVVYLQISIIFAFIFASPYCLHQIWQFIVPGLYRNEKKQALKFTFIACFLFLLGLLVCYFIIFPIALKFFISFQNNNLMFIANLKNYVYFISKIHLAFALVFQLPLFLLLLNKIGLITKTGLRKNRGYVVLIIFIVAAVLTPPDVLSQCLMALPLLILFELSVVFLKD